MSRIVFITVTIAATLAAFELLERPREASAERRVSHDPSPDAGTGGTAVGREERVTRSGHVIAADGRTALIAGRRVRFENEIDTIVRLGRDGRHVLIQERLPVDPRVRSSRSRARFWLVEDGERVALEGAWGEAPWESSEIAGEEAASAGGRWVAIHSWRERRDRSGRYRAVHVIDLERHELQTFDLPDLSLTFLEWREPEPGDARIARGLVSGEGEPYLLDPERGGIERLAAWPPGR